MRRVEAPGGSRACSECHNLRGLPQPPNPAKKALHGFPTSVGWLISTCEAEFAGAGWGSGDGGRFEDAAVGGGLKSQGWL